MVRGGLGAARRTIGFLGGILTYAVDAGIIERNPVHGIQRPKGNSRTLGAMLAEAARDDDNAVVVEIIRQLALTGCRRGEMIKLQWSEVDYDGSCLRLADSKEGASVRPVGLTVVERLERRMRAKEGAYVFPGRSADQPFGYFQIGGSASSMARLFPTSRPTSCATASRASPTISGSPRSRLLR